MFSRVTLLFTNTLREAEPERRAPRPAEVEPETLSLSAPPLDALAAPPVLSASAHGLLKQLKEKLSAQKEAPEDKRLHADVPPSIQT